MIRRATKEDENFIRSSWLRSFSSSELALAATPHTPAHTTVCATCGKHSLRRDKVEGAFTRFRAGQAYWSGHGKVVDRLLDSCNVSVYESPDESLVDGWIVRELVQPVVHYVYVRHSARNRGVARALLADLADAPVVRFTHWSQGLRAAKVPEGWQHDVYALLQVKP